MSVEEDRVEFPAEKLVQYNKNNRFAFAAIYTTVPLAFILIALINGFFGPLLWIALYFVYAALMILSIHFILFSINWGMGFWGNPRRRHLPRYVEYLYAAVLCLGIFQVFLTIPRLADYVLSEADEPGLLQTIRLGAKNHWESDCAKPDAARFTGEFCEQMKRIAQAPDVKAHLLSGDAGLQFLNHPIGTTPDVEVGHVPAYSPIVPSVLRLLVKNQFMQGGSNKGALFAIIAMLLVPVGIGLRIVKTSLELFGQLDQLVTPPPPMPRQTPFEGFTRAIRHSTWRRASRTDERRDED